MLLVDHDQPEVGERARRPPSAARRRRAPRRGASATTRRSARGRVSCECRIATSSPKRSTKRPAVCGVSAISGTSTIADCAALERGRDGAQVDLGLAAAGDAVQQQRHRSARRVELCLDRGECRRLGVASAPARRPRAPTPSIVGRRGGSERCSQLDEPALLEAAQRPRGRSRRRAPSAATPQRAGGERPQRGALARRRGARAPATPSASRPAVGQRRAQRAPRPQRPGAPGAGARRQHQREAAGRGRDVLARRPEAEPTSAAGTSASSADSGSASRSGGSSLLLGHLDHHAQQPPAAERHHQHAAHPHALELAEPVVERPPQRAGGGQRLDLGDHASEPTPRARDQRRRAASRHDVRREHRLRGRGTARGAGDERATQARLELLRTLAEEGFSLDGAAPGGRRGAPGAAAARARARRRGPALHPARAGRADRARTWACCIEARRALGLPAIEPDERIFTEDDLELSAQRRPPDRGGARRARRSSS